MARQPKRIKLGSISDTQIDVDSLRPDNIVTSFSKIGIAQNEDDVVNLLNMMHYFSQQLYINHSMNVDEYNDTIRTAIAQLREY